MREFGYYILFGACRNEQNYCETTKDNETYFQEHNLQLSNKILLHHAISIILIASKKAEADLDPLMTSPSGNQSSLFTLNLNVSQDKH